MTRPARNPWDRWDVLVNRAENASFPRSQLAEQILLTVPEGLVVTSDVMNQFLDEARVKGDPFSSQAWEVTKGYFTDIAAVTPDEFSQAMTDFRTVQTDLQDWHMNRWPLTDGGYPDGPVLPDQAKPGTSAWSHISSFTQTLSDWSGRDGVGEDAQAALEGVSDILWQYVECMALEVEAMQTKTALSDVRDQLEAGARAEVTGAWTTGVQPDNVTSGGMIIGAERLPPLPDTPDPDPGSTTTTTTTTTTTGNGGEIVDPTETEDPEGENEGQVTGTEGQVTGTEGETSGSEFAEFGE